MSETKFTEGPWHSNGHSCVLSGDNVLCVFTNSAVTMDDAGEDYANANLTAAAPELYAMLDKILNSTQPASDFYAEAEQLLAKARGEA